MAGVLSSSSEHEANATANTAQTIHVANLKNLIDFICCLTYVYRTNLRPASVLITFFFEHSHPLNKE